MKKVQGFLKRLNSLKGFRFITLWRARMAYLRAEKFPPSIVIENTTACNLRCQHCSHKNMTRKKGNMEEGLFRKIIEEIAREAPDTRVWMTFYGEALLLKKYIHKRIAYAKKIGCKQVILNTNGTFMDEEVQDNLIKSGLDELIVSIDAITKETYDKIRIGGDYDATVKNTLSLLKKVALSPRKKPRVVTQFSIMEENEHELDEYRKFWKSKGAIMKPRPKLSWGGTVDAANLATESCYVKEGDGFFDCVKKESIPNIPQTNHRYPCYWMMNVICITWDGYIPFCANDFDVRITQGDVSERTIKSIWQNEIRKYWKAQLRGDYSEAPVFCQRCLDWNSQPHLDSWKLGEKIHKIKQSEK